MRQVIAASFQKALLVRLRLRGLMSASDRWTEIPAKIDTGMSLSGAHPADAYDIGLVLSNSLKGTLGEGMVNHLARYRSVDGRANIAPIHRVYVQLECDGGALWPDVPADTEAIFLPRADETPALIGRALWQRWRVEIDGPKNRFNIWVPDDEIADDADTDLAELAELG